MQDEKRKLNLDLGFLDESKSRETQAESVKESSYRTNWRNIILIVLLIFGGVLWLATSNNLSPSRYAPSYTAPGPTGSVESSQTSAPSTTTSESTSADIPNGQFSCSQDDSAQADRLMPAGKNEIDNEADKLNIRQGALDKLLATINGSPVTQNSSQAKIKSYNSMVDRYNTELASTKAAIVLYNQNLERFNQQVDIHNNYLIAHCRRRY